MGAKLAYYLFLKPLSMMPFWVLYIWSDALRLVLFKIFKHRREVIMNNLINSFPDKSEQELHDIRKKFEKHFCDTIVESLKNFSISEKQINKHVKAINPEIFNKYIEQGRSIVLTVGHYNNWETTGIGFFNNIKGRGIVIFKKIKNEFLNQKVTNSRSKFGLEMIEMKEVAKMYEEGLKEPTTVAFIGDQWPSNPLKAEWIQFLNQETAFMKGAEKYAKMSNSVVLYIQINKEKRGYYSAETKLITEQPNQLEDGQITKLWTKELEKTIQAEPAYWLWTHKRWKKSKKEVLEL